MRSRSWLILIPSLLMSCAPAVAWQPEQTCVEQLAAGVDHSLAVRLDGSVWAWGRNDRGQLGIGTRIDTDRPRHVPLPVLVTAVAAGRHHSLALGRDGSVWAWGDNAHGQLGLSPSGPVDLPVPVSSLSVVTSIAAGGDHSLAVQGGRLFAWGRNDHGQLGDGTFVSTPTPGAVRTATDELTRVSLIAAGNLHSLAVSNGQLFAWGAGSDGQLGRTPLVDSARARHVPGAFERIIALAAGARHSLMTAWAPGATSPTAWAWGDNSLGQIARPSSIVKQISPRQVLFDGEPLRADRIAAGAWFSIAGVCGQQFGWGDNRHHFAGPPPGFPSGPLFEATFVLTFTPSWWRMAAGGDHLLWMELNGSVFSRGRNDFGQLGNAGAPPAPRGGMRIYEVDLARPRTYRITCPPSVIDDCAADSVASASGRATVEGGCAPPSPPFVQDTITSPCSVHRTWRARVSCAQGSSTLFPRQCLAVTVIETLGGLTVPEPVTIECDRLGGAGPDTPALSAWLSSARASSSCGEAEVTNDLPALLPAACGDGVPTAVEFTAQVTCGDETRSESSALRVVDSTPPLLMLPPDELVLSCTGPGGVDRDDPRIAAWLASAEASDICSVASVQHDCPDRLPAGCVPGQSTIVTFTATDECGNAATGRRTIRVVDETPPRLDPPAADLVVECDGAGGIARDHPAVRAWLATASASDECSEALLSHDAPAFLPAGCGDGLATAITFRALDDCGNEAMASRRIVVRDSTPPRLTPPPDARVECPPPVSGPGSAADWLSSATAIDQCGNGFVTTRLLETLPGCGNTFTDVYEFQAVDECGNASAPVVRRYEVVDTTPPVFIGTEPPFHDRLWPPNHFYETFDVAGLVRAEDGCGDITLAVAGCRSDQPEEAHGAAAEEGTQGDGRTFEDCVWEDGGTRFAVRRERLGACGPGSARTYSIEITATDACGNVAVTRGLVSVDHDQSAARGGSHRGPPGVGAAAPPFEFVHGTLYGDGCSSR